MTITLALASPAPPGNRVDRPGPDSHRPRRPARPWHCDSLAAPKAALEFQLVYGLPVGAGAGAIFAPLMAPPSLRFDTSAASPSAGSAGMGIAPMTVAPWPRG
jgi:hypothetical protein